jgi:hypothetical protein
MPMPMSSPTTLLRSCGTTVTLTPSGNSLKRRYRISLEKVCQAQDAVEHIPFQSYGKLKLKLKARLCLFHRRCIPSYQVQIISARGTTCSSHNSSSTSSCLSSTSDSLGPRSSAAGAIPALRCSTYALCRNTVRLSFAHVSQWLKETLVPRS